MRNQNRNDIYSHVFLSDVHYVVTENGIAFLFGKTIHERARLLINIAHPDHRPMLIQAAKERFIGFHM